MPSPLLREESQFAGGKVMAMDDEISILRHAVVRRRRSLASAMLS
jgi:hypothetical protein